MFPAYQTLTFRSEDGAIGVIGFNRPEAANALNTQMALDLKDIFTRLPQEKYRALVLTGEGKIFCAGADLKERRGMDETQWQAQHQAFEKALRAIMSCRLPVIAAVNGPAMGGGLELALACDFIYAAEGVTMALPEVGLGIIPGLGGTQQLARAIGERRAREIIFTGMPFTATDGLLWGLVNMMAEPKKLLPMAVEAARNIAVKAPLAVQAAKQAIHNGMALPITEALERELEQYRKLLNTRDRHEGINAFNEKRKPVFTGE